MKCALIQSLPVFGDIEGNLRALIDLMDKVEAELYVLPELCLSGYDFEDRSELRSLALHVKDPLLERLSEAAASRGGGLVFGFAERAAADDGGERLYNSALLALPDGRRRLYRKTHLFFRETTLFDPGDTGFFVEEFRGLRIGPAICFDWIFPESFRSLALLGADLIAHCANLVMPHCQRADFVRAIENRVYIATANRVGRERRKGRSLSFTGESVLVAPDGEYLARLSPDQPDTALVDIDPRRARDKRLNPYNDLFLDRRPEMYAPLAGRG